MIKEKETVHSVKLYFDEDVSSVLAARLRKAGWDVLATHQARRCSDDDLNQLRFATSQKRILVTRNYADFLKIHSDYLESGESHTGIIICFWRPNAQKMQAKLLEVLKKTPPDQWTNQLLYA